MIKVTGKSVRYEERTAIGERNDCTVRALAAALDIPYLTAYGMLIGAGRKRYRGIVLENSDIYDKFAIAPKMPRPNMTVENYIKYVITTGNWIVHIRGHVFAVINGVIIDTYPEMNLTKHVICAWRMK